MPDPRKKWSFRRWRRRWKDRLDRAALHIRIWVDRHVVSRDKLRQWRRRWDRRKESIGRAVENVGYSVLPHRREAVPDTRWTRFLARIGAFVDRRLYPPALRVAHARVLAAAWQHFTAPFRNASAQVQLMLDAHVLPSLTPAGFRKRFVNWKGLALAAGLVGLGCLLVFWLVPQWRLHNEQKWAAQARLLLGRGYQSMAYQNAVRVLRSDKENEEANRVVADMLERQNLAEALAWRRKVVAINDAPSNQLALAATGIKLEAPPCPTASRILNDLSGAATNTLQFNVVAAQLHSKIGNPPRAEAHYLAALQIEPANPEIALALAVLRLQMRDPAKVAQAEESLQALSESPDTGIPALRALMLLAGARGEFETALDYSLRILSSDSSTFEDRLAHLGVLTLKRDPERDRFLSLLQEQVSANPVFVAQLSAWMTARGEARAALAWLNQLPPAVRSSDPVLLSAADAYVAEQDWRGLESYLLAQRWGTIEFARQAMLARAARGLNDSRAFRRYFERAKELASGMTLRLVNLTRLVTTWGWDRELEELVWEAFDRYPKENWAADTLLRRYYERGDTDGLRRVFLVQLKRTPDDIPLKNNLAMVLLLLKRDLPLAHQLAAEVHEKEPGSAVNTSTYAFSLHVQGKSAEARRLMESLGAETLKVPSLAAYYALLCEATGDAAGVRTHLEFARQARLLPEEQALLDGVRRRL